MSITDVPEVTAGPTGNRPALPAQVLCFLQIAPRNAILLPIVRSVTFACTRYRSGNQIGQPAATEAFVGQNIDEPGYPDGRTTRLSAR